MQYLTNGQKASQNVPKHPQRSENVQKWKIHLKSPKIAPATAELQALAAATADAVAAVWVNQIKFSA